jgi:nondiscriminating glutamyl-tRNA synthetase
MPLLKTRFAPSPTGLIHFGNVRTALFNVLFAKKEHGVFLLRIEDTDAERSRETYIEALQQDLRWLGLDWQEGETAGGAAAPYRQSQRSAVYDKYLTQLEAQEKVYPCFCTALELEVSRKVQAAAGKPPRYSGKCAHLKADEAAQKKAEGMPYTLRFRMPKSEALSFDDVVRGAQKFPSEDIGDFIIRRSDGSFAFFFVNAVDDALMGVTHVLRGEDHLTNTPRQIALLQAMALPVPIYGHISLIVDDHGAPLSKRGGSLSVQELREMGYFPIAVNNYLARLGHHFVETELMNLDALAAAFDQSHLGRAPARYDRSQLDYWQGQAVQKIDEAYLLTWLAPALKGLVPEKDLTDFARAVRANIVFPHEARLWAEAVFNDTLPLSDDARRVLESTPSDLFRAAVDALSEDMDFKSFANRVKQASGVTGKGLFLPLRAALTGQTFGPEMPALFSLIAYERARHRLTQHVLSSEID